MTLSRHPDRSPLVQGLRDRLASLWLAWLLVRWFVGTYHQHRKQHHGGGRRHRPQGPGRG